jgi:hypothetical protein
MNDGPVASAQQQVRQATPAQVRRIAKARPYVPLHDLRRTYGLPGDEEITTLIFADSPRARVVLGFHSLTLHA